jgi:hypothetical protein
MAAKAFTPPKFRSLRARFRYWWRYGTWNVLPEQCLTCVSCNEPIFPGTPIADGPVHRTFDCCCGGIGGWSVHDPKRSKESSQ